MILSGDALRTSRRYRRWTDPEGALTVQPWLYALVFIAMLLSVGWVVDRHASRIRRRPARPTAARLRETWQPHP